MDLVAEGFFQTHRYSMHMTYHARYSQINLFQSSIVLKRCVAANSFQLCYTHEYSSGVSLPTHSNSVILMSTQAVSRCQFILIICAMIRQPFAIITFHWMVCASSWFPLVGALGSSFVLRSESALRGIWRLFQPSRHPRFLLQYHLRSRIQRLHYVNMFKVERCNWEDKVSVDNSSKHNILSLWGPSS